VVTLAKIGGVISF